MSVVPHTDTTPYLKNTVNKLGDILTYSYFLGRGMKGTKAFHAGVRSSLGGGGAVMTISHVTRAAWAISNLPQTGYPLSCVTCFYLSEKSDTLDLVVFNKFIMIRLKAILSR